MFLQSFTSWDLSLRKFLSSCCSGGHTDDSEKKVKSGNPSYNSIEDIKDENITFTKADTTDMQGNAYAYDDQETSSDSDDEVLKRYQNSLVNQPGTVKPAASSRSIKSLHSRKSVQLNERSSDTLGKNKVILAEKGDEKILVEGSGSDVASEAGDSSVQEPVSSQGDSVSPQDQDQTADREGFDNQAFQGEVSPTHSALSDRTHSMGSPDRTSDEHLFDVSDLHQEPPLISKCGSLEVTFAYDAVKSKMKIIIHQAREIPSKDRGGANNSQVRLLLLPTKKQRHKTKIRTGENPIYDDTFVFHKIPKENLMNMGVRFRLYGCERMRRERMIGESIIGFASLNPDIESTHWVVLEPRSNLSHGDSRFDVSSLSRSDSASSTQSMQHGGMPELLLGLSYNGTTGRLMVEVVKGSNFRNMAMNRAPDTYVKLTMMSPTGQEISRSKTSIRRGQPNPLFKETFVFQVALFQLPEVTLMVSVYNKRSMKRKEMIGWFSLGMNSSGEEELSHWSDMRENKGDQVCRWHVLLES